METGSPPNNANGASTSLFVENMDCRDVSWTLFEELRREVEGCSGSAFEDFFNVNLSTVLGSSFNSRILAFFLDIFSSFFVLTSSPVV